VDQANRVRVHAALADASRLAIVDALALGDRTPRELGELVGLPTNLLAHHLEVLRSAGLVDRRASAGDGRRRYVVLRTTRLAGLVPTAAAPVASVAFVCTGNSARSQLAAALWETVTAAPADSAGTHPADRVHPGAVAAGRRAGLDITRVHPRRLDEIRRRPALVVTVCDRAHEELDSEPTWLHWSIPDPVSTPTRAAFDATVAELRGRISALVA
jgi:ArsR family transcriptional regulator, arsenate/arsenite/antimonite-responsive transcriptional repressor / arsenate reductase (thioredoxin)